MKYCFVFCKQFFQAYILVICQNDVLMFFHAMQEQKKDEAAFRTFNSQMGLFLFDVVDVTRALLNVSGGQSVPVKSILYVFAAFSKIIVALASLDDKCLSNYGAALSLSLFLLPPLLWFCYVQ